MPSRAHSGSTFDHWVAPRGNHRAPHSVEGFISALAVGVAVGASEYYLSEGIAMGVLVGVVGFLVAFAIFELLKRR